MTAAVASAQHDLEGCFDEWAERPDTRSIGSARPQKTPTDFDVVVTLDVTPTGVATNAQAEGQDIKKSDVLKFCVENALTFVRYPQGPEMLSLEVEIAWAAPNMVSTSARVVGHHEARGSNIDL